MRSTRRSRGSLVLALALLVPAVLAPSGPALAGDDADVKSDAITSAETLEAPTATLGARPDAAYVPGRVLVGFRPGAAASDRAAARAAVGATASERLSALAPDVEVLTLPSGRTVEAAIAALQRNPNVRYAEPDYVVTTAATSNDPLFTNGSLWGMYGDQSSPANGFGSQAAEAWAAGHTGSSSVYVVVIDEGLQTTHPDLADNVWTNPYDPIDGIDNDRNGFVDDVNGWDFVSGDNSVYDGSGDDHGTHVAGTIGAVGGNGIGVAGVAWDVTMISAKFLGSSGGTTANAVRAVDYATDLKTRHGLNIVATSNSWGGGGFSQSLLDAINRGGDAGILFVAAAGNSSSNNDGGGYYPSGYPCTQTAAGATRSWDCVVAVAATTSTGGLAGFSSYGATTVDLGAPGESIRSTLPGGSYDSYSGTSMATPHVSGAVALCAAIRPGQSAAALRRAVVATTAPTVSLAGRTVTGGRLDVGSMVAACTGGAAAVSGAPSGLTATATGPDTIRLDWSTAGVTNAAFQEVQRGNADCTSFATIATFGVSATSVVLGGFEASTTACFRVRATNDFSGGTQSAWSNTATGRTFDPPAPYVCSDVAHSWLDATAGGTRRTLSDDSSVTIAIGFPFPFYGADVTSATVSSNGFLMLGTSTGATTFENLAIPNTTTPNGLVAAFWDDLDPGKAGEVWTRTIGSTVGSRQFVVSWIGVPHYSTTGGVTFQAVLDEATGSIAMNHLDTTFGSATYDRGASATVGVESPDGRYGTQVSRNAATILDGTSRRCATSPVDEPGTLEVGGIDVSVAANKRGSTGTARVTVLDATSGRPVPSVTVRGTWTLTGTSSTSSVTATTDANGVATVTSPRWTATDGQYFRFCLTEASASDYASVTATTCGQRMVAPPLTIATSSLGPAVVDVDHAQQLSASGGDDPYVWSLAPGSVLPGGLTLSSSGLLAGRATTVGSTTITVVVADEGVPALTASRTFTLSVTEPSSQPASVSSVSVTSSTNRKGTTASALVTIVAAGGAPGANVGVQGVWSVDGVSGTTAASGTTGSGGTVTLTSPRYAGLAPGAVIRFCVTTLTVSGVAYPLATPVCGTTP